MKFFRPEGSALCLLSGVDIAAADRVSVKQAPEARSKLIIIINKINYC